MTKHKIGLGLLAGMMTLTLGGCVMIPKPTKQESKELITDSTEKKQTTSIKTEDDTSKLQADYENALEDYKESINSDTPIISPEEALSEINSMNDYADYYADYLSEYGTQGLGLGDR